MSKKLLVVPMSLALHTKLKWHCRQEGRSMSRTVRGLIHGYLNGSFTLEDQHLAMDPTGPPGRPTEREDFYEELYEKVSRAVDS